MDSQSFDYIVVGAGSAGSALAYRLSESGRNKVLLLEAGRPSHPWSRIPIGFARLIENPKANWLYSSEPEANTDGRRIPVPRGKLLGGSSSINGMVFVRGNAADFDHWSQLGNRGWSYRDVLPFFKQMESYDGGDDEFRGRAGPLKVSDLKEGGPLYDCLMRAADEVGMKRNPDYNGADQDGIAMTQATIRSGRRMSTAHCYLEPARSRANLKIETEALSERLLFEGTRCVGVAYSIGGQKREARAGAEVVVCAGAINSPQLLELSGIGQGARLSGLGIEVHHELAGVGENLRDHYAPRMRWAITQPGVTYNDRGRGIGAVGQALKYAFTGTGMLGLPASPIRTYVRTREGLDSPDVGISVIPFMATADYKLDRNRGITVITHPLRPESLGSIHVASADAGRPPAINFNFLDSEIDRAATVGGMRMARDWINAKAMDGIRGAEIAPGQALESDDELLDYVRRTAETTYHPVGTCKMGPDGDAMAVLDDRLRVRGLQGLRVADASIMPTLTSGNTNAPSIMIGEKAAAMVLEDAA